VNPVRHQDGVEVNVAQQAGDALGHCYRPPLTPGTIGLEAALRSKLYRRDVMLLRITTLAAVLQTRPDTLRYLRAARLITTVGRTDNRYRLSCRITEGGGEAS
jgi:hypothetical protein